MTASYVGWLDFTDSDRERAMRVIAALGEHDTVDELGLGGIRDALSDEMFPGTSVLHTRARYHLFIPWIYLRLERRSVPSAEIRHKARNAELDLGEVLASAPDNDGVIGIRVGRKLKRLPSELYWQGQQVLGIRRFPGSREAYHRSLDRFYAIRDRPLPRESEEAGESPISNWDPNLPDSPEGFPKVATMTLTDAEAQYLRERIVFSAPSSYFRYLVQHQGTDEVTQMPWDHGAMRVLPPTVRDTVEHARRFSTVMHGAALLYNLILSRLSNDGGAIADFGERLEDWGARIDAQRADLTAWNLPAFWALVIRGNARVSDHTRSFVHQWLAVALGNHDFLNSGQAVRLIKDRERRVKGPQARVDGGRPLERWSGEAGLRQLSYRWLNVQRILRDLNP